MKFESLLIVFILIGNLFIANSLIAQKIGIGSMGGYGEVYNIKTQQSLLDTNEIKQFSNFERGSLGGFTLKYYFPDETIIELSGSAGSSLLSVYNEFDIRDTSTFFRFNNPLAKNKTTGFDFVFNVNIPFRVLPEQKLKTYYGFGLKFASIKSIIQPLERSKIYSSKSATINVSPLLFGRFQYQIWKEWFILECMSGAKLFTLGRNRRDAGNPNLTVNQNMNSIIDLDSVLAPFWQFGFSINFGLRKGD